MALSTTTKLEAVNTLLGSIGESPVNSLNSGLVDAKTAENIIDAVSREIQSQGWTFNTDYERSFQPDGNNQFLLPSNILRIEMAERRTSELDVVARGNKLYNRATNSYYFDPSVTAILMNAVVLLEFEDLTEAAKRYILLGLHGYSKTVWLVQVTYTHSSKGMSWLHLSNSRTLTVTSTIITSLITTLCPV